MAPATAGCHGGTAADPFRPNPHPLAPFVEVRVQRKYNHHHARSNRAVAQGNHRGSVRGSRAPCRQKQSDDGRAVHRRFPYRAGPKPPSLDALGTLQLQPGREAPVAERVGDLRQYPPLRIDRGLEARHHDWGLGLRSGRSRASDSSDRVRGWREGRPALALSGARALALQRRLAVAQVVLVRCQLEIIFVTTGLRSRYAAEPAHPFV